MAPGVITGDQVQELFSYAKANQFAIPGVNVTGTNTVNTVLETAVQLNAPVIIQFSNGGAAFLPARALATTANAQPSPEPCLAPSTSIN